MSRDTVMSFALSLAGPAIWFAHFSALYGAATLICNAPGMQAVAAVLTLVALLAQFWMFVRAPAFGPFLGPVSRLLAVLSAVGVLWAAFPTFVLRAC